MGEKPERNIYAWPGSSIDEAHNEGYAAGLAAGAVEIKRLHSLLDRVMVSGNHLATHVDLDGPTWRASFDDGLTYYGAGPAYDAWCCWKGIMLVREDFNRG